MSLELSAQSLKHISTDINPCPTSEALISRFFLMQGCINSFIILRMATAPSEIGSMALSLTAAYVQ